MLTINLLPEEARKTATSRLAQFHRIPLLWIVVTVLAAAGGFAWVTVRLRRSQLRELTAGIEALRPRQRDVEALQQSLQALRAQETEFRSLASSASRWAKPLNALSDATPEDVWFTELHLDPVSGLVIRGSVIGRGGSEIMSLRQLVQRLKADTAFSAVVQEIQIESVSRAVDGDIDVVQFTLACTLRGGQPAS